MLFIRCVTVILILFLGPAVLGLGDQAEGSYTPVLPPESLTGAASFGSGMSSGPGTKADVLLESIASHLQLECALPSASNGNGAGASPTSQTQSNSAPSGVLDGVEPEDPMAVTLARRPRDHFERSDQLSSVFEPPRRG